MQHRSPFAHLPVYLVTAVLAFCGCADDALRPAEPTAPSLVAQVSLPEALGFTPADGAAAPLPAGDYLVSAEGDRDLMAVGSSGSRTRLAGSTGQHALELTTALAVVMDRGAGCRDLILLLPDGTCRTASGSGAGPRTRELEPARATSATELSIAAARSALRDFLALAWLDGVPAKLDAALAALAQVVRDALALLAQAPRLDRAALVRILTQLRDAEADAAARTSDLQAIRNERQEYRTMFENLDQKMNQLFNILGTVLKNAWEVEYSIVQNIT